MFRRVPDERPWRLRASIFCEHLSYAAYSLKFCRAIVRSPALLWRTSIRAVSRLRQTIAAFARAAYRAYCRQSCDAGATTTRYVFADAAHIMSRGTHFRYSTSRALSLSVIPVPLAVVTPVAPAFRCGCRQNSSTLPNELILSKYSSSRRLYSLFLAPPFSSSRCRTGVYPCRARGNAPFVVKQL